MPGPCRPPCRSAGAASGQRQPLNTYSLLVTVAVAQEVGDVDVRLHVDDGSRSNRLTATAAGRTWKDCWSTLDP